MKKHKKWTFSFILITLCVLFPIGFFNYIMDPFWSFNFPHPYNSVQLCLNEREQKVNAISFRPFHYDGLLIGDSRVTYMNQYSFKNHKIFNLAASGLGLNEIIPLIQYAETKNKRNFKIIYMGINFFSYFNSECNNKMSKELFFKLKKKPERLSLLFNLDILKFAYRTFKSQFDNYAYTGNGLRIYTYDNVAYPLPISPSEIKKITDTAIKKHQIKTYKPDKKFSTYLINIREAFPDSEFIIFTTPVSAPLFNFIIKHHLNDYKNCLRTLVNTFGRVYHFMYLHPLTQNYTSNFVDSHHYLPSLGDEMIKTMEQKKGSANSDRFGILLDRENLESYLKNF